MVIGVTVVRWLVRATADVEVSIAKVDSVPIEWLVTNPRSATAETLRRESAAAMSLRRAGGLIACCGVAGSCRLSAEVSTGSHPGL